MNNEDKLSFVEHAKKTSVGKTSQDEFVILVKGNSISCHGFDEKTIKNLGWDRECGMAASCSEKDYVHLFADMVQSIMPERKVKIIIGKGGRPAISMETVDEEKKLRPDLIIVQNGEHSAFEPEWHNFAGNFDRLLKALKTFPGNPPIISIGIWNPQCREEFKECTGENYFEIAKRIELLQREVAIANGVVFVPVSPYENDPENTGSGAAAGVRWHPSDSGMKCYAQAAFEAFQEFFHK